MKELGSVGSLTSSYQPTAGAQSAAIVLGKSGIAHTSLVQHCLAQGCCRLRC
jgi:hypothetical protein